MDTSIPAAPAAPVAPATISTAAISSLAQDAVSDIALGQKVVAAYKSGGVSAASALLSDLTAAAQKNYADVKAALPSIKAGWKTTEFWLTTGVVLGNGIYTALTGKVLPLDLNAVLGAVIAIYTAGRSLVKK